jgi:N-acyl-D-aspartate/D-glutamate deacylase
MGRTDVKPQFDLVIRGGSVLDGTGADARTADIGVVGARIEAVGRIGGRGREEIDAGGALVTPGFVDIHSHYDGQATWADRLAPSSHHGVTTTVAGNCGVGFAPVRANDRARLVELMEGVEDIPGTALHEGLPWAWESFPDYLDFLEPREFDMDLALHLPHAALRVYVMGERGASREPATPEDIAAMRRLTREAIAAGAVGFSTSRTLNHRSSRGEPTPTLTAETDELAGIAAGLRDAGGGVLQMISDLEDFDAEFALFRTVMEVSGRPLSISLAQGLRGAGGWRRTLDRIAALADQGYDMRAQVAPRPIGILLGLTTTLNPLIAYPSYRSIRHLRLSERLAIMADPGFRARLLAETAEPGAAPVRRLVGDPARIWVLGDPPDYEQPREASIAARAAAVGRDPWSLIYDLLLEDGGRRLLYTPFANYADDNLDCCREMILHRRAVMGLGDGGAHVGTICDASYTTYLLTHWGRDRSRGPGIDLPTLVRRQSADTAAAVGLKDRGVIAPGLRADLNVIDFDRLGIAAPRIVHDLPAGGARLDQRATGYVATVVAGAVTYRNGEPTGALPGRLVRGTVPA